MFEDEEDDSYIYKATTLVSLMTTTTHILRSVDASSRNSNIEGELLRAMCWSEVSLRRKRTVTGTKRSTRERERKREKEGKKEKRKKRASEPRRSAPSLFNFEEPFRGQKRKKKWIILSEPTQTINIVIALVAFESVG